MSFPEDTRSDGQILSHIERLLAQQISLHQQQNQLLMELGSDVRRLLSSQHENHEERMTDLGRAARSLAGIESSLAGVVVFGQPTRH
jgi:hypothetical protein